MIKKFSSPKIKIWFEPMFFAGSWQFFLAAIKFKKSVKQIQSNNKSFWDK